MEAVRAQCETQINAFSDLLEDLPDTDEPVWLLGEQYCVKAEKSELLSDIRSRLWFTYRKKFCPIGGKLALFDEWNSLAVYVSMDNTVVIEDIKTLCKLQPMKGQLKPSSSGQECFKMPQSLGVLGGKPNLAYYFIGFIGDELIYLDPHTTQAAVDPDFDGTVDDQSYHCQRRPRRMKILNLDPSVAVEILKKRCLRMFELVEKHPPHWPPFIPPTKPEVQTTGAELIESMDKLFESEEEFEILNV
ncbi:UNVERIFIED_CONTAM: hypothetical protein FKN15_031004 [Acipenser sinensis]